MPGVDPAPFLRASGLALQSGGRALGSGDGLHRLHPTALLATPAADSGRERFLTVPDPILATEQGSLIAQLAGIADEAARRNFLRLRPALYEPAVVERICEEVVQLVRADLQQADRLAQASRWLARKLKDDYCRAQSLRATGHVLYVTGKYSQALARY